MYKKLSRDQTGAVSMITVIFITVILTILTTSFIRLSINEQRESTDDDLTTRAYYAAESGVQDAISAIKTGTVDNAKTDTCEPNSGDGVLSDASNLDTAYTCQIIDETPTNYQAYLQDGESVFFKLESPSNDVNKLRISWHIMGDSSDSDGNNIALRGTTDALPQKGAWDDGAGSRYPAMLRTQMIAIPESNVTRSNINNYVGFLNPSNATLLTATLAGLNGGVSSSDCDSGANDGEYVCVKEITNLDDATSDFYIRVQSLYRATHIKIEAINSSATAVAILNAQAVIDVTGRATDVYRRVEERVSLIPDDLWPDYAILSAEDICKDFVITDAVGQFNVLNGFATGAGTSCQ